MNPFALLQQQAQIAQDEAAVRAFRMRQNQKALEQLEAEVGIYRAPSDRGQYRGAFVASQAHHAVAHVARRRMGA